MHKLSEIWKQWFFAYLYIFFFNLAFSYYLWWDKFFEFHKNYGTNHWFSHFTVNSLKGKSVYKLISWCTVGKKRNPIYFNTNYRTEMKLVPIIMDYFLLQFDAFKFFLGGPSIWVSLFNFNFININPEIFHQNCKLHLSNYLVKS